MNAKQLIYDITENFLKELGDGNCAFSGNNGPYNEDDLPVRNTAHWLVILSILYKETQKEKYKIVLERFAEYLRLENKFGKKNMIKIRNTKVSNYTNGLMGVAWVIEALMYAAETLGDDKYYERAKELFNVEFFDEELSLWKIVDIDDEISTIDYVYNHQLWFAAAGCMMLDYKFDQEIDRKIKMFLNSWRKQVFFQPSGLIYHQINFKYDILSIVKKRMKTVLCDMNITPQLKAQKELERGYQIFDLYGFALLYDRYKDLEIFGSVQLKRACNFFVDKKNIDKLYGNKYSYAYNSPAFEYPFVAKKLMGGVDCSLMDELLSTQIELCYSENSKKFDRNTCDANTLTARIYELVRFFEE